MTLTVLPPTDQAASETHAPGVVGGTFSTPDDHTHVETHGYIAAGVEPSPSGQTSDDAQSTVAAGHPVPPTATGNATPVSHPPSGDYTLLGVLAATYSDLQAMRIGITNRIGAAERDGVLVGDLLGGSLADAADAEHKAGLAMRRCFRKTAPHIAGWVKETPGVGEHLVARLLGTIGDPVLARPYHWEGEGSDRTLIADPPFERSVSQLWSYCGYGDPARKKAKGMTADEAMALGSPRAKMIVHLVAVGAMKCVGSDIAVPLPKVAPPTDAPFENDDESRNESEPSTHPARRRSPYRDAYELGRIRYADRDGWTPLHQHNAALRLIAKEFLRDLWLVARESA